MFSWLSHAPYFQILTKSFHICLILPLAWTLAIAILSVINPALCCCIASRHSGRNLHRLPWYLPRIHTARCAVAQRPPYVTHAVRFTGIFECRPFTSRWRNTNVAAFHLPIKLAKRDDRRLSNGTCINTQSKRERLS